MDITFFKSKPKLPDILQSEVAECGLASVAMCLQFHGLSATLPLLRNKYNLSKNGSSIADLSTICENEGLVADVYELGMEHLEELPLPAVVHWDLCHFVVLKSVSKKKCVIHDPAVGVRELPLSEFSKHFTGIAMSVIKGQGDIFSSSKTFWEQQNERAASPLTFKGIFQRSRGLGKGLVSLILLTLVAQVIVMLFPVITQLVVDDFIGAGEDRHLLGIIMGGVGLTIFLFFVRMIRGWASIVLGYHWHAGFSSYFFQRLVRLPVAFFESRNIADVNTKFRVLDKLKSSFTEQLVNGLIDGLMSALTLGVMFAFMPSLAIISLIFLIVYSIIRIYLVNKEIKHTGRFFTEDVMETHTFFETISNMLSVKLYGKENSRYQYWKGFYLKKMNAAVTLQKLKLWYTSSSEFLGHAERLIILFIGALAVIEQQITLGMMFAFFAYREIFSMQSKSLLDNVLSFKILRVELDRLSDIEVAEVEDDMLGDSAVKPEINGEVAASNLGYAFPGASESVLNNVNFTIKPGEKVVITGPSGSGKTTLIRLLAGVMSPSQGDVIVDGHLLKGMGHHHYRKNIAFISQQEGLISGSIFDNIAFSSDKIDKEKAAAAAKAAHVYGEIMNLPMQFHTLIAGHHASMLSGGQVQRILIARALYSEPKILFMDEATSALDSEMAKKVSKTLDDMNMTQISIAHRLETIEAADREIKLENINDRY
jgi:ATP-binding cassette subfamily B protein RaxB